MSNGDTVDEAIPLRTLAPPQVRVAADVEEIPLNMVPGLGNEQEGGGQVLTYCCSDRHYRRLAVCSIICGCSCIGCIALINSVKAETMTPTDPEAALTFSHRAKKFGIISILTFVGTLVFLPLLIVLISYLLTLID